MRQLLSVLVGGWMLGLSAGQGAETRAGLIHIDGAIGPATADYIQRAITVASGRGDVCLVIRLDTPGGLLDSTKDIVQSLYASQVPTVVYVAPEGANAGSAGCFITLAADVAAMAPNTSIGAAHPVSIGGNPVGGEEKPDEVMKEKLENYASSYIESIAKKRHRNVEWARSSVIESASITAEEALKLDVIDLIAKDLPDLLRQLDGRTVNERELVTEQAEVVEIPMIARERVFQLLWRPEVMFILMLVAIYGIIGELSNPGAILPGTVGAIALILVLYMSAILPVNIAGFAFIVLAIGLFIADAFAPTHGVLTAGGIIAFALGTLMLFNTGVPGFNLSLGYIIPGVLITAGFFIFVVSRGLRAQFLPVRAGRETLIGRVVKAEDPINAETGRVFVEGEYWNAVSDTPVEAGRPVEIVAVQRLVLKVKPKL
ncbi:MAG: nodulation protein NfeD [Verrucomicrobia bacterium]|jgi:membrane-bound serine protease (ClpP class)|nr:nodulation protein NfeD [Verrucomicrobiota bacterium]